MRVFISWSGERSRFVADCLRSWLPLVIQSVKPWMSEQDISAGSRWLPEISNELSQARVGIICVTPENQLNPWLLFEAGALSKTLDQTFVCPILFDLLPAQLTGPLAQFQANTLSRDGIDKILNTLNRALKEDHLSSEHITEILEVWWPRLDGRLKDMPIVSEAKPPKRAQEDMLEELVENTREQLRRDKVRFESNLALQPSVTELKDWLRSTVTDSEKRRKRDLGLLQKGLTMEQLLVTTDGQANADIPNQLMKLLDDLSKASPSMEEYLKPPPEIGGTKDEKA